VDVILVRAEGINVDILPCYRPDNWISQTPLWNEHIHFVRQLKYAVLFISWTICPTMPDKDSHPS